MRYGHYTRTEIRPGPQYTAACPCGWRAVAASHEHSHQLGQQHEAEMNSA